MDKKKFTQSLFDQAFVNVVSYLYNNKRLQQKEFANELGMPPGNLSEILSGIRGVPKNKIEFAKFLLCKNYDVRPEYLETAQGPFLNNPVEININEYPQVAAIVKENELLKLKNQEQETRIKDLRKLNETQEELINTLKEQLSKQAKK